MSTTPAAQPPLFVKSLFQNMVVNIVPLPNQPALEGKFVFNEFSKIGGMMDIVGNYTMGATFIATEYVINDESTMYIKTVKPFFFNTTLYKGSVPAELEITQAEYEAWIEYLLTAEPEKEGMDSETIAQEFVQLLEVYGVNVDLATVKAKVDGSSGMPAGPAIMKTIAKKFPVPTLDKTGFSIKKNDWELYVRNILKVKNTLLAGPTGSGKTEVLRVVCEEMGIPLNIVDMGTMQDAQAGLQGTHRLDQNGTSVFDPAPFVGYIQQKGVILLDELNRSPLAANNILFSCLDSRRYLALDIATHGDDRKIAVHPECVFFATANMGMEYTGTQSLDRALLDRFMIVQVEYPQMATEIDILIKRTNVNKKAAKTVVEIAQQIRELATKDELSNAVSVRHTLEVAEMITDGFQPNVALQQVFLPLFNDAFGSGERSKVNSLISAH